MTLTGRRGRRAVHRQLDRPSPLFLQAIYTNESLPSVLIGLLRPDGGQMATVKLTNAQVSDDVQHGTKETISFTYQKIAWTWLDGGITAEDDWSAPSS